MRQSIRVKAITIMESAFVHYNPVSFPKYEPRKFFTSDVNGNVFRNG